jgi:hypothetical protein
VPDENTPSQRWVERTLTDGSRECGPWPLGEGGTITFLAGGKVAVGVAGPAFQAQKKKVIRRFKVEPVLLAMLEAAFQPPYDGRLSHFLQAITRVNDSLEFDRYLDALLGALRAIRELRFQRFETATGRRFINAVQALACKHKRPPFKIEITNYLCCELSQTSKWCREHGFEWLPNAPAGRRK